MTYRTIFMVRARYEGATIDSWLQYEALEPGVTMKDLEESARVAFRMTGEPQPEHEAITAAKAVQYWDMRKRFNSDVVGPFNVVTDEPLTEEEALAWFKTKGARR